MVERAKDVAAGAVLIAAIGAVAIGLLVFVPHLLGRVG
jgi:diacylglycerol kinase (ATP)